MPRCVREYQIGTAPLHLSLAAQQEGFESRLPNARAVSVAVILDYDGPEVQQNPPDSTSGSLPIHVDIGGDIPEDQRPGSVRRTHEPSKEFREDSAKLPLAPRVRRDNLCNPDSQR